MSVGPSPAAPASVAMMFGRPSRLAASSTANPSSLSLAATIFAAASSRPGSMSGSSGFSAAGWPAGTRARASATQRCSVISEITCDAWSACAEPARPLGTIPIGTRSLVNGLDSQMACQQGVWRRAAVTRTENARQFACFSGSSPAAGKGNKLPCAEALPRDRSH